MNFEYSSEYLRDVKRLDNSWREPLRVKLEKIMKNPQAGKPMSHLAGVFSERILNKRLIYKTDGSVIKLVCFKSRDEVYEYLKRLGRT